MKSLIMASESRLTAAITKNGLPLSHVVQLRALPVVITQVLPFFFFFFDNFCSMQFYLKFERQSWVNVIIFYIQISSYSSLIPQMNFRLLH